MALLTSSGFAHVRLTVTDIARSKTFYDEVFGWPVAVDTSAHVAEPGVRESPEQFYGGVVYQTPSGSLFGLRPVGAQRFDSERTGLDHVSFMVPSRHDLVEGAAGARPRRDRARRGQGSERRRDRHPVVLRSGRRPPRADRPALLSGAYQVSTNGRFLPVRAGGGGALRSPCRSRPRVSAGSITSSISKYVATFTALPRS